MFCSWVVLHALQLFAEDLRLNNKVAVGGNVEIGNSSHVTRKMLSMHVQGVARYRNCVPSEL